MRSYEDSLWAKTVKKRPDECWLWTGYNSQSKKGVAPYGRIFRRIDGRLVGKHVHIISWEIHFGKIPVGLVVCHKCDNTLCVNPNHLFLGTNKDNMQDAKVKNRLARGKRNSMCKLSDEDVVGIKKSKELNLSQLARKYNVSYTTISRIVGGLRRCTII